MKKRKFIYAIIFCTLFCLVAPLYAAIPALYVDGNKIKDPCGNEVVLRGISLIDLGHLQDWQGGVINMLNRITDKTDPCGSSIGWYPKIIRIPIVPADTHQCCWPYEFNPNDLNDPANESLYNLLRTTVNACAAKDMYAIIDWHYIDDTFRHVQTTSAFWTFMAPRFANDNHVMFELYNEPTNGYGTDAVNWMLVRKDMQTWINIVRTYAPDNIILVGGPSFCQTIGPVAGNPPIGDDIAIVSHIYPAHWLSIYGSQQNFKDNITTCAAAYPVIMTEWGFTSNSDTLLNGTITNYGQPLMDFREQYGISNTAWVASYNWGPPMFWEPPSPLPTGAWPLRIGEGEMGGFTKDKLYQKKDANQPNAGTGNRRPIAYITSLLDGDKFYQGDTIVINANAYDREGSVTKVEFYQGTTKLGEDTTAPYSYTWNNVPAGRYDLIVKATDNDGWVKTSVPVTIYVYSGDATGTILREWWTSITGANVSNLTSDINYPNDPTGRELLTKLEVLTTADPNFGTRIRGYLYPPATGNYTFWIASDDRSELWLSTDADAAHISKIAEVSSGFGYTYTYQWDKYTSQKSSLKSLTAGGKYYIEILHKQNATGNHVEVSWQGPGVATQQIIDGVFLSPYLYNFKDYSVFASQWLNTGCNPSNAWCSGADRDRDGKVQLDDLKNFVQWWLLETN
jgi:hypothetical protein